MLEEQILVCFMTIFLSRCSWVQTFDRRFDVWKIVKSTKLMQCNNENGISIAFELLEA